MGTKLKFLGIAAKWLFILCLPVLLVTVSLGWAVNSLWLYKHGYQKYGVSQTLASAGLKLSDAELEKVYAELINYFNSKEDYVSITVTNDGTPTKLFTQEETIHFKDVKGLIWLDYKVLFGTLIYTLAYAGVSLFWRKRQYWHQLAQAIVGGSGITLAAMLALGSGALLGFGQLFYQFHLVFFSNKFWSAEGYMLLLFPEPLQYDIALFFVLITVGLAIILGGAAGSYLYYIRSKASH